ncbi:hypothetical protein HDU85_004022 [Gaertneriomyces sp. JEL0708]|nr:hypothetical protein HDU85_004022 [Gaertneriomyces sp. JEL0708]
MSRTLVDYPSSDDDDDDNDDADNVNEDHHRNSDKDFVERTQSEVSSGRSMPVPKGMRDWGARYDGRPRETQHDHHHHADSKHENVRRPRVHEDLYGKEREGSHSQSLSASSIPSLGKRKRSHDTRIRARSISYSDDLEEDQGRDTNDDDENEDVDDDSRASSLSANDNDSRRRPTPTTTVTTASSTWTASSAPRTPPLPWASQRRRPRRSIKSSDELSEAARKGLAQNLRTTHAVLVESNLVNPNGDPFPISAENLAHYIDLQMDRMRRGEIQFSSLNWYVHSMRKLHEENGWEWEDVRNDPVVVEKWNAAKSLMNEAAAVRARARAAKEMQARKGVAGNGVHGMHRPPSESIAAVQGKQRTFVSEQPEHPSVPHYHSSPMHPSSRTVSKRPPQTTQSRYPVPPPGLGPPSSHPQQHTQSYAQQHSYAQLHPKQHPQQHGYPYPQPPHDHRAHRAHLPSPTPPTPQSAPSRRYPPLPLHHPFLFPPRHLAPTDLSHIMHRAEQNLSWWIYDFKPASQYWGQQEVRRDEYMGGGGYRPRISASVPTLHPATSGGYYPYPPHQPTQPPMLSEQRLPPHQHQQHPHPHPQHSHQYLQHSHQHPQHSHQHPQPQEHQQQQQQHPLPPSSYPQPPNPPHRPRIHAHPPSPNNPIPLPLSAAPNSTNYIGSIPSTTVTSPGSAPYAAVATTTAAGDQYKPKRKRTSLSHIVPVGSFDYGLNKEAACGEKEKERKKEREREREREK